MTPKSKWTNWRWYKDIVLGGVKWLLAVYMMLVGIATPFVAGVEVERLGWVYTSEWSLYTLGIIIFLSGLWLFIGKIRRHRQMVGQGLMACFCCFWFASVLNSVALGTFDYGNFVVSLLVGALYLRWRYTTAYVDPNHFRPQTWRRDEHH